MTGNELILFAQLAVYRYKDIPHQEWHLEAFERLIKRGLVIVVKDQLEGPYCISNQGKDVWDVVCQLIPRIAVMRFDKEQVALERAIHSIVR